MIDADGNELNVGDRVQIAPSAAPSLGAGTVTGGNETEAFVSYPAEREDAFTFKSLIRLDGPEKTVEQPEHLVKPPQPIAGEIPPPSDISGLSSVKPEG